MTTAGIQPGGQRWLWKLPDEEVTERWERDRRGWVADKAWEGVDVESVTLTFSMLATEDEVTLTSDPAALGLQLCLVHRVRELVLWSHDGHDRSQPQPVTVAVLR